MTREEIREKTMKIIFQMDANGSFNTEDINVVSEDEKVLSKKQAKAVLAAISEHISDIDEIISANIDNWKIDRLPRTDLAILRLAVCEMKYIDDIPVPVSINEAVNLARKYGDEKSYAFVNSVLGKIAESI